MTQVTLVLMNKANTATSAVHMPNTTRMVADGASTSVPHSERIMRGLHGAARHVKEISNGCGIVSLRQQDAGRDSHPRVIEAKEHSVSRDNLGFSSEITSGD